MAEQELIAENVGVFEKGYLYFVKKNPENPENLNVYKVRMTHRGRKSKEE